MAANAIKRCQIVAEDIFINVINASLQANTKNSSTSITWRNITFETKKKTLFKCKRCETRPIEARLSMRLHFSLHVEGGALERSYRRSFRNAGKMVGPFKQSNLIRDVSRNWTPASDLRRRLEQTPRVHQTHWVLRVRAIDIAKPVTRFASSEAHRQVLSNVLIQRSREMMVIEPTIGIQQECRHSAVVHYLICDIILGVNCSRVDKLRAHTKLE